MKMSRRHLPLIIEAVGLTALFAFVGLLDYGLAVSLYWVFYGVIFGLALLITAGTLWLGPRKPTLVLLGLFNLGFFFLHFTSFGLGKSFILFHQQIREGMTTTEVQQLFDERFPATGRYARPVVHWTGNSKLEYWMDAKRDPMDVITVTFGQGRVVKTEYIAD